MRADLAARYVIGEPSYETEFIVYPAEDKRLERQVFIVVPDLALKSDKARMDRVWASVNEAKALPALRFVEIVDLVAATDTDPDFYIVERRFDKTLRSFLEEQEAITLEKGIELVRQVLEGVATLHGAGYAHNALTDSCLYVSDDYSGLAAKIGNLHLIAPIGERIIPPYVPEFGPPETHASGTFTASAAVDVYAVGMIAYKIFLPRRIFADVFHTALIWDDEHNREQSWKNIHLDPAMTFPRLDTLLTGFPPAIAALVERMLSREPSSRPRDGVAALEEFRHATLGISGLRLQEPVIDAASQTAPKDQDKGRKKTWTPLKIAAVVAILLVWVGVGAVTIPSLLGPDPKLVQMVEVWRKDADARRKEAIAAGAPSRPAADEAFVAYGNGAHALDDGTSALDKKDYKKALGGFQAASDAFDLALLDIARDSAAEARKAAEAGGGAEAPAFKEAAAKSEAAAGEVAAGKRRLAINSFKTAAAAFSSLAAEIDKMAQARTTATERRKIATAMGAQDDPAFAAVEQRFAAAAGAASAFNYAEAAGAYDETAQRYAALIDDILAAREAAETLRAETANLVSDLSQRIGADHPELAPLLPRVREAEALMPVQAYKRAVAAYTPLAEALQALSQRGFCPSAGAVSFSRVEAGAYKINNIRLMTGSLAELGGMLGMANGEIRIATAFCLQDRLVTRGEIADFLAAQGAADEAGQYRSNPEAPADDVPQTVAEDYVRWFSAAHQQPVRLPSAQEWISGVQKSQMPPPDGVSLQWSATPCNQGGHLAFLAQDGMSFAVCSDDGAGGYVRLAADTR